MLKATLSRRGISMAILRTVWVLMAALALCSASVVAQGTTWKANFDAGWEALKLRRYAAANTLFLKAVSQAEAFGEKYEDLVGDSLNGQVWALRGLGKSAEAEPIAARALSIAEKAYNPEHPKM